MAMQNSDQPARLWMIGGGVLILAMAAAAVTNTPLVGTSPDAWLRMNAMHGEVHALGAILTILAGIALRGRALAYATLGYGAVFVFAFVSNLASPDFFGTIPDAPANLGVHLMHLSVAVGSLVTGYAALPTPLARLVHSR